MDLPPPSYDDVVFSGPDTSPQAVAPAAPPYFEEDVPEVVVKQPLFSTNGSNLLSSADASNQNAPPAPPVRQDKSLRQGDRLIIDFEKVSCCPWETTGLPADCEDYIPEELYSKGITNQMWHEWCTKLNGIQAKSPSVAGCLCLFCIPGFIAQCVLCAIYSPTSAHHPCDCLPCFYGDWYHELKKWQRNVNYELNKRGMHAKLKTYKPHSRAPQSLGKAGRVAGKDDGYEMSMLEIALSVAESEKLQREPWDNGVNDGCTSGNGRVL